MDSPKDHAQFTQKLNEFRLWASGCGRFSFSTVARQVRRLQYISKHLDLLEFNLSDIYTYIEAELKKGKKKKSVNNDMKDVQAWLDFLGKHMELPRFKGEPAPEPWMPTDDQLSQIIRYCRKNSNKGLAKRNELMFEILAFGGLRIGEMLGLNVEDVTPKGIYVRSEKGEQDRTVGLPDGLIISLEEYIHAYRYNTDPRALFTSSRGRIEYNYTRNLIKRIGIALGMPLLHAHALRHYCATSLLKGFFGSEPLDIREVQIHLGHARIETTAIYTHISQKEVAEHVRLRYNSLFPDSHRSRETKIVIEEPSEGSYSSESEPELCAAAGIRTRV